MTIGAEGKNFHSTMLQPPCFAFRMFNFVLIWSEHFASFKYPIQGVQPPTFHRFHVTMEMDMRTFLPAFSPPYFTSFSDPITIFLKVITYYLL